MTIIPSTFGLKFIFRILKKAKHHVEVGELEELASKLNTVESKKVNS